MLGNRIKKLRRQMEISQEQLGRQANVGNQQIWRYEKGEQIPNADTLARIAQALNTSADYLIGLTDDPSPHVLRDILSSDEQAVISAWRRGDVVEAIRMIVNK